MLRLIEAAIVAAFKAIGHEDLYRALDLGHTRTDVQPRWDAAIEHDAFCRYALVKGDPTAERGDATALPALPTYDDESRGGMAARPVIAAQRLKDLDAANAERAKAAKDALAVAAKAADGPQLLGSPGELKTFKLTGTKAVITLTHHSDYNVGANLCVNGYGLRVPCPTTRTFAEWPAAVKLAKGDTFTMFGKEATRTRKGSNTKVTWTVAVDGQFLVEVTQAGTLTSFVHPAMVDSGGD